MTISVTFIIATIINNTPIDGGSGVYLMGVDVAGDHGLVESTIYLLGLAMAVVAIGSAWAVSRSRLGLGLFAIHDDEDVAEAKGVPTFRYKLAAFALSAGIAGAVGAIYAIYVSYLTTDAIFDITVTMYPVVMSIFGGARHWLGPALGATTITAAYYANASGPQASLGRAVVALMLILVILLMPDEVMPAILRRWYRIVPPRLPAPVAPRVELPRSGAARIAAAPLLDCRDVRKSFGGIQALKGVSLSVQEGEILGLVGPNGSGKSTFIDVITGHFSIDTGTIAFAGSRDCARRPSHRPARNRPLLSNPAAVQSFERA